MLKGLFRRCLICQNQVCCSGRSREFQTEVYLHEEVTALKTGYYVGYKKVDKEFSACTNGYIRVLAYKEDKCIEACKDGQGCTKYGQWRPAVCRAYPFFPLGGRYVINSNCEIYGQLVLLSDSERKQVHEELKEFFKKEFTEDDRVCLARLCAEYDHQHFVY